MMIQFPYSTIGKRRGQSLVEFALILPLLLLFIMGTIDFGRALFTYAQASSQLRQALRLAAVIGYDPSATPPYQDCDRMRSTARSVFFAESVEPEIMYLRVVSSPSSWDALSSSFTEPTIAPDLCDDTFGPDIGPGGLKNGDVLRIREAVEVRMITPLFPQLLTFTLQGQRTVITSIALSSVEYCGDLVCQVSKEDDVSCPEDCLTGGTNAPTITLDTPICGTTLGPGAHTVQITAGDSDPGDGACSLNIFFVVNGALPGTHVTLCAPATAPDGVYTFSWDTDALGPGTYSIMARAIDHNTPPHTSATTACNIVVSDNNPPELTISPSGGTAAPGVMQQISVDASDVEDGVYDCSNPLIGPLKVNISVNNGTLSAVTCSGTAFVADWVPSTAGPATITASTTDSNGTPGSNSAAFTVVAPGAPTVNFIPPPIDGSTQSGTIPLHVQTNDTDTPYSGLSLTVSPDGGTTYLTEISHSESGPTIDWYFEWNTTTPPVANGTYTIVATVNDGSGPVTASIQVTVANVTSMDISDISVVAGPISSGQYNPTVTVTVKDNLGQPAAGVTVSGGWLTDEWNMGPWSCVTDASGQCSFTLSPSIKKQIGITFSVTSVTHATLAYDPTLYPTPTDPISIHLSAPG